MLFWSLHPPAHHEHKFANSKHKKTSATVRALEARDHLLHSGWLEWQHSRYTLDTVRQNGKKLTWHCHKHACTVRLWAVNARDAAHKSATTKFFRAIMSERRLSTFGRWTGVNGAVRHGELEHKNVTEWTKNFVIVSRCSIYLFGNDKFMQKTGIIRLSKLRSQQCNSSLSGRTQSLSGRKLSNDKYFREFVCASLCGFYVPIGTDRRHKFYDCRPKLCCKYGIEFVSSERCNENAYKKDKHKHRLPSFNQTGMCAIAIILFASFWFEPVRLCSMRNAAKRLIQKSIWHYYWSNFVDTLRLGLHVRTNYEKWNAWSEAISAILFGQFCPLNCCHVRCSAYMHTLHMNTIENVHSAIRIWLKRMRNEIQTSANVQPI